MIKFYSKNLNILYKSQLLNNIHYFNRNQSNQHNKPNLQPHNQKSQNIPNKPYFIPKTQANSNPQINEPQSLKPDQPYHKRYLREKANKMMDDLQKKPLQEQQQSSTYQKSSTYIPLIVGGITFIVSGLTLNHYLHRDEKQMRQREQNIIKGKQPAIGGYWQLQDLQGNLMTSDELEGKYYLIYFGFTRCPDICPNMLFKLSRVMRIIRNMPEYKYMQLQVLFVTIDPQFDTKDVMRKFLKNFDQNIIGLRAESEMDGNLKDILKKFKIYANKIYKQNSNDYIYDHTVITYFIDSHNRYLGHINPNEDENIIAQKIVNHILIKNSKELKRIIE